MLINKNLPFGRLGNNSMFLQLKIFMVCLLTAMNFETFWIIFYSLGLNVSPKTERIKNDKKLTLNQTLRTELVQFQQMTLKSYEFWTNVLLYRLSEGYLGKCHKPRVDLFCENSKRLLAGKLSKTMSSCVRCEKRQKLKYGEPNRNHHM